MSNNKISNDLKKGKYRLMEYRELKKAYFCLYCVTFISRKYLNKKKL